MPKGGRRPGSGGPKGNANALKTGEHSIRGQVVVTAMRSHPNARELLRLALIVGLSEPTGRFDPARAHAVVAYVYAALTDRNHPMFNQINQAPESGRSEAWPDPRLTEEEFAEIKPQSKLFRGTGVIHPRDGALAPPSVQHTEALRDA
jgi:hypothetical protein